MNGSFRDISPLTGTFAASEDGLSFTLTLELGADGLLLGQLRVGELAFEVYGISRGLNSAQGFVVEPVSGWPLALLRVSANGESVTLELAVQASGDVLGVLSRPRRMARRLA